MPPSSPDPNHTPDAPDQQQPPSAPPPVSSPEPARIRTSRYGELDTHELLQLLDTIEDERARGRFRESIYISIFIWLIIAWLAFYGPRYLWHAPTIRLVSNTHQKLTTLNMPTELHAPRVRPTPPVIDNKTLEHLRETDRAPRTPAPAPAPQPTSQPTEAARPSTPQPAPTPTPSPQPVPSRRQPPVLADAPTPQPSTRPSLPSTNSSASENMREAVRNSSHAGGSRASTMEAPIRGGGSMGAGSAILTDTQGVDFSAWKRHFDVGTINAWRPLLPEEIYPPLSKSGETFLLVTIMKDGSIGDMKLESSSHDEAINRSCWGSIVSQGRFDALPKEFPGNSITLRLHYLVNMDR